MNSERQIVSKAESELVSPNAESVYLDLLRRVMEQGSDKADRTGVGTRSTFGDQIRFNLNDGFPLLTTKKVPLRPIIHELLWFIKGDTNIKYLLDNNVHIWDEWPFKCYLQLSLQPFPLPNMRLNPAKSKVEDFVFEDFALENYQAHPAIKAPVAVQSFVLYCLYGFYALCNFAFTFGGANWPDFFGGKFKKT